MPAATLASVLQAASPASRAVVRTLGRRHNWSSRRTQIAKSLPGAAGRLLWLREALKFRVAAKPCG